MAFATLSFAGWAKAATLINSTDKVAKSRDFFIFWNDLV
jgi:hypothetical protein